VTDNSLTAEYAENATIDNMGKGEPVGSLAYDFRIKTGLSVLCGVCGKFL